MAWIFSRGEVSSAQVRAFVTGHGLDWNAVVDRLETNGHTATLEALAGFWEGADAVWFEVGRNLMLVSNLATTASVDAFDSSMRGFRALLDAAGIELAETDRIEATIRHFTTDRPAERGQRWDRLCERLEIVARSRQG